MRKHLFTIAMAITALMATTSCSNEESIDASKPETVLTSGVSQAEETAQIKLQIQKLGETHFGSQVETRSFWDVIKNIVKVVKDDLKGASNGWNDNANGKEKEKTRSFVETATKIVNSVTEGVSASINAFKETRTTRTQAGELTTEKQALRKVQASQGNAAPAGANCSFVNDSTFAMSNLVFNTNQIGTTPQDSIGYYHNAVIYDMTRRDPEVFNRSLSSEEMAERILTSTSAVMKCDAAITSNPEVASKIAGYLDKYEAMGGDIKIDANGLDENSPEVKRVLELIDAYLSAFDSVEDLKKHTEYTQEVYKIVDDSNLDDFTKENFKIALSVAFASSKLWNPESMAEGNE